MYKLFHTLPWIRALIFFSSDMVNTFKAINSFNEYNDPNYNGVIQQRAYNGRIVHLPWNHGTPISLPHAGNFNMDRL